MTDLEILAKGVLETAYSYDVQSGKNACNECNHCPGFCYWDDPVSSIEHTSNCPVKIAESVNNTYRKKS